MPDKAPVTKGDLRLSNLTKAFGEFLAVDDLTLIIPEGSFFALLGPSGCGKTTTLRMIAGLEEPTAGKIEIGSSDITFAKPYARPVNTVFQNYALFPHLTIFENVAFGLRRRGIKDVKEAVTKVLDLVELGHLAQRKPAQLSGGQAQRIAVARAIVNRPALLLLDEPLGALDLKLRRAMQIELKWIQTEVGLTFVHVTHDQEEAMTMADTIAVMNEGRIEQMGSPVELYESPRTVFVANFLGQSNLVKGKIESSGGDYLQVSVHGNRIVVPTARNFAMENLEKTVLIGIRPEKISIEHSEANTLGDGKIIDISFVGVSTQFVIEMPWGQELTVFEQNDGGASHLQKGDTVQLSWKPEFTFALDGTADVEAGTSVNPDEL